MVRVYTGEIFPEPNSFCSPKRKQGHCDALNYYLEYRVKDNLESGLLLRY